MLFLPKYKVDALTTPDGARIDYFEMGTGTPVLLIPGAGDGMRTVAKHGIALAQMFKNYAKRHRLIIMSRREPIPEGYTMQDFAEDYVWAVKQLHVKRFHLETNSGGGPIGQWIAVKYPGLVKSLVLGQTFAHTDARINAVFQHWIRLARDGKWYEHTVDSIERTFTVPYVNRKYRWMYPLFHFIGKPQNPNRIIRVYQGLMDLDNRPILQEIKCPTLIIGGALDQITHIELQNEMAKRINNAKQVVINDLGHGQNIERSAENGKYVLDFYDEAEKQEDV